MITHISTRSGNVVKKRNLFIKNIRKIGMKNNVFLWIGSIENEVPLAK